MSQPPATGAGSGAPLYDCHCHLHAEEFDHDRSEVVARARAAGVRAVLAVAEDAEDAQRVLALACEYPDFARPAIGVHPDRVAQLSDAQIAAAESLIRKHQTQLAAIGEVGLDFRPCWDERVRARQREVLCAMAALSRETGLTLSVHSRSAGHHAISLLLECGAERVCMHAFDGRAVHALRGAEAGYRFSLPPSIVRSPVKQKLARRLPEQALLLETDSPVLGPDAAERNEPANLPLVLGELARLRDCDPDALAQRITRGTAELFPRLTASSG